MAANSSSVGGWRVVGTCENAGADSSSIATAIIHNSAMASNNNLATAIIHNSAMANNSNPAAAIIHAAIDLALLLLFFISQRGIGRHIQTWFRSASSLRSGASVRLRQSAGSGTGELRQPGIGR
ncbi:MAG: hypothetical protein UZ07_CHB004001534 [Chlorobi bacterium OLB7]|nr:MAG: hypothetical protein UZ07_CHB004001534 [Chlorobi bacterium OLB7]